MGKPWVQDEINLLVSLAGTYHIEDLAKKLGRTPLGVRAYATKHGISLSTNHSGISFLLDGSLNSCYWLGFILADGTISQGNNIRIELSAKDTDHLKKLAILCNRDVSYRTRTTNFVSDYKSCMLTVGDTETVGKLKSNFGIGSKKHKNPPNISNYAFNGDQLLSLFVGFVDGDGSITYYKSNGNPRITIQTDASWINNLEYFRKILGSGACSINNRNHACLSIGANDTIKKIILFIKEKSLPVLERKWSLIK